MGTDTQLSAQAAYSRKVSGEDVATPAEQVRDWIREAATESPSGASIREEVIGKIEANPDLKVRFIPFAIRETVDEMCYQIQSKMREQAVHNCRPNSAKLRAEGLREAQTFWEEYTVLGVNLRDADVELLEQSAQTKRRQATGKLRRAGFEEKVMERLDEGQTVGDVWTLDEIKSLADELLNSDEE